MVRCVQVYIVGEGRQIGLLRLSLTVSSSILPTIPRLGIGAPQLTQESDVRHAPRKLVAYTAAV